MAVAGQSVAVISTAEKERRAGWTRWVWRGLLTLAALALFDGLLIEPFWIQVTHSTVEGNVATPLKIAELSDIHARLIGPREREMFRILEKEKPDLIVVTGDTLGNTHGDYSIAKQVYERLHAPLGVWVVRGNWENLRVLHHEQAFYKDAGVHLLLNQNAMVRPDVALIGLDDPYSGNARLDAATAGVPAGVYTIALFHSPAYLDVIAGKVDLALAGHTHGGQIRIPFIRPLWLPRGCGRFLAGWYEENGTKMYVTRGIGTSIVPIRFLCRPELTIINVVPSGEKQP
ncbi:MAG TPA: metallophosphoesterase [Candidatus Acidoferrum sp.]|nr:metallophosphoesterase [Candidatus Acidoferrum sp.]